MNLFIPPHTKWRPSGVKIGGGKSRFFNSDTSMSAPVELGYNLRVI